VYALDIDPVSIKTAQNNCRINGCEFEYLKAVKFEDFRPRKQFDFVAANLLTEDLIRLQKKLIGTVAPGGCLAVSGIFHENYAFFRKHFASRALVCAAVARKKDWCAVLFRVL
jgi:ribosomal protein L11 methylase PrmA